MCVLVQVVLASDMSLDYGFSKALLLRWASEKSNTILLTGRGHGDSTARSLLAQLEDRERAAAVRKRKKLGKKGAKATPTAAGEASPGENTEDGDGVEEEEAPITLSVKVRACALLEPDRLLRSAK